MLIKFYLCDAANLIKTFNILGQKNALRPYFLCVFDAFYYVRSPLEQEGHRCRPCMYQQLHACSQKQRKACCRCNRRAGQNPSQYDLWRRRHIYVFIKIYVS